MCLIVSAAQAKTGNEKGEVWKDLTEMWVERMLAEKEEAERVELEKLKVIARTNPDAGRAEIWAMANEKNPNSISRREAWGVFARRNLHITTNVKWELSSQDFIREGWDQHGHTGSRGNR